MRSRAKSWILPVLLVGAGALLSGCAQSRLRIEDDFGQAVSQDLAAQIANPDAARTEGPAPPSSGARAALAQTRYQHDTVVQPSTIGASGNASGYGSNGSGAGAGGGSGVGEGASAGTTGP